MVQLVERAQDEKAAVQRLADRIAQVFVPTVISLALLTGLSWVLISGSTERAWSAALAVLIVACPCALGLATPTALFVSSGRGAQLGIFIKGYEALEQSRAIDTVLIDKTGTVTEGRSEVVEVCTARGMSSEVLLGYAGAVEHTSEHVIAQAIASAARGRRPLRPVEGFQPLPGLGAEGTVERHLVVLGNRSLMDDRGMPIPDDVVAVVEGWSDAGFTVVFAAVDGRVMGALAIADVVKASARLAVDHLRELGLTCILLTGDSRAAAGPVATAIGADQVIAEAGPEAKVGEVRRLQSEGRTVAFVGDGVNDGPALSAADLGLAIGSGTDVALQAADMILVRDTLETIPLAITLARRTLRTINGNLMWAFVYNLAAIPLAVSGLLNPLIAGASMALSSSFVVWNSSRLRRVGDEPSGTPIASEVNDAPVPVG